MQGNSKRCIFSTWILIPMYNYFLEHRSFLQRATTETKLFQQSTLYFWHRPEWPDSWLLPQHDCRWSKSLYSWSYQPVFQHHQGEQNLMKVYSSIAPLYWDMIPSTQISWVGNFLKQTEYLFWRRKVILRVVFHSFVHPLKLSSHLIGMLD